MKSPILLLSLLLLFSCGKKSDDPQPPVNGPALKVEVNFNNNTYAPLTYTTGRTDSPADADPAYKAEATGGQLVFSMPASPLRPKLSGFLDLPQGAGFLPVSTDFIHEFTFPDATQLTALGASPNSLAIAGCYLRGAVAGGTADWANGDGFGGFWFGFVKTPDGQRLSAIRSGNAQVASEPIAATGKVSYRIDKKG
ncbi:MAG: hypothetical protein H7Y12_04930, partial [Sphingobacteriaceae bacterium]|nr:hypothetical protein [Cytophagaceae bacterium]